MPQTEVWQRGPVPGYEPLLMPVVHALLQAREDLDRLAGQVPSEHVWLRPGGAASIGFHVRHTGGALDRLFTYARGETLSDAQKAALREEGAPGDPPVAIAALVSGVSAIIDVRSGSLPPPRRSRCSTNASLGGLACRRRCSACCFMPPNTVRGTSVRRLRRPES